MGENRLLKQRRLQQHTGNYNDNRQSDTQNENRHAPNAPKRICIEERRSQEDSHKMSLSSLNKLFSEQSKPSRTKSLPCAHNNGGSAVSPTRNSPLAAQYTHLLWVMPWTTSHLMLSRTSRPTISSSSTKQMCAVLPIFSLIKLFDSILSVPYLIS